jgi:hypothetical protein
VEVGPVRRVRVREDYSSDRFLLIIVLMIVFFAGVSALEIVHMLLVFGSWNDVIFNGIMLIESTIVGAVWGRQSG